MKQYIKPEIEIIEIETESLLQSVSPNVEVFDDEESDESTVYSKMTIFRPIDVWED